MTDFRTKVIKFVNKIPKGKIVSYGQIASASNHPRAARTIGGILRSLPADTKIPWWRVVNNQGIISIKGNWFATKEIQRQLLIKENVKVSKAFTLDINKYRYRPKT